MFYFIHFKLSFLSDKLYLLSNMRRYWNRKFAPYPFQLHFNKYHPTVTLEDYYENFIKEKKSANVAQAKTSTPKVAVKRERTESGTSVFSFG